MSYKSISKNKSMWRYKFTAILLGLLLGVVALVSIDVGYRFYAFLFKKTIPTGWGTQVVFRSEHPQLPALSFRLNSSIQSFKHEAAHWGDTTLHLKEDDNFVTLFKDQFYINQPGVHSHRKTVVETGETVFNITYEFDKFGRRVVPLKLKETRPYHFLTLGCSQTLGYGVDASSTVAAHFTTSNKKYAPYILAQGGASPAHVLALIRHFEGLNEIQQKEGIAIFRLFTYHFPRLVKSMGEGSILHHRAYAKYTGDGKIDVSQTFEQGRPIWSWFVDTIKHSAIVRAFGVDYPLSFGDPEMNLMADVLVAIRHEYHQKTSANNPFIVILGEQQGNLPWAPFLPYLEDRGLLYLDYGGIGPTNLTQKYPFLHDKDRHYTSDFNLVIAKLLSLDLAKFIE